jgi:hypothetical protein
MGAIAIRLLARLLATTHRDRFCLFRREHDRADIADFVRAIAKWLLFTQPTGAPGVFTPFLKLRPDWEFLRNYRICHRFGLLGLPVATMLRY